MLWQKKKKNCPTTILVHATHTHNTQCGIKTHLHTVSCNSVTLISFILLNMKSSHGSHPVDKSRGQSLIRQPMKTTRSAAAHYKRQTTAETSHMVARAWGGGKGWRVTAEGEVCVCVCVCIIPVRHLLFLCGRGSTCMSGLLC